MDIMSKTLSSLSNSPNNTLNSAINPNPPNP